MNHGIRCLRCGSDNIHRGHQEMFPSTFLPDVSSKVSLKNPSKSKEFEVYACFDCGHTEWYIQE